MTKIPLFALSSLIFVIFTALLKCASRQSSFQVHPLCGSAHVSNQKSGWMLMPQDGSLFVPAHSGLVQIVTCCVYFCSFLIKARERERNNKENDLEPALDFHKACVRNLPSALLLPLQRDGVWHPQRHQQVCRHHRQLHLRRLHRHHQDHPHLPGLCRAGLRRPGGTQAA